MIKITRCCLRALHMWRKPWLLSQGPVLGTPCRRLMLTADASLTGWGVIMSGRSARGLWGSRHFTGHLNCLEMLAMSQENPDSYGPGILRAGPSGEERGPLHSTVPISPLCPWEISLPTLPVLQGAAVSSEPTPQSLPPGNVAELGGEAYQCRVLPSGLALSPPHFHQVCGCCSGSSETPGHLHTELYQRLLIPSSPKSRERRPVTHCEAVSTTAGSDGSCHPRPREWMLHPEMVKQIWRVFGQAQVDIFVTQKKSQCPLWFSLTHSVPLGLDAMVQTWLQR
ncbi:hypothetical protein H4Q32_030822 [Labeo rohita]|uniref:Uncharacterized protein n=1 Tax=Labeo rohita TaxID=84645 RepID=A0ABQ8L8E2_LABRO|nr:hypothetical protein H4Q32_030822 [Labeo rohita]